MERGPPAAASAALNSTTEVRPTPRGSTQSNDPWITKNVLPTAHSHVQNRIKKLMARSRVTLFPFPRSSNQESHPYLSHLMHP